MTFREIECAYTHNLNYGSIQDWLKDNHSKIFYKNRIQKENPFICGIVYGIVKSFINSNIHTEEIPTWLYQYIENNKDRLITCVDGSAIIWAKNFTEKLKKYDFIDCYDFKNGEALFLDFFHGEYNYDLNAETKLFKEIQDIGLSLCENLKGKLTITIDITF